MFNLVSVLIGAVLLVPTLIAFVPLLGWLYWAIVPLALIGLVIGLFSGESRAGAKLNGVIVLIGLFRLTIFGGIL